MSLRDIFCQDKAIDMLERAYLADRTAHAYIFAGPDGVGRGKTADELAKLLLCASPKVENDFADSCRECESCKSFEAGSHCDLVHIYKELVEFTEKGKGKSAPVDLPIDVIREFLIAGVSKKPMLSQRKVFVISEGEKLNIKSQNALLKVLEEPPGYCCIILLCTRLEKLLATTKSRCQIVRFGPIEKTRILDKLAEMGVGKNEAIFFAGLSEGSIGMACKWGELELAGAGLYEAKRRLIDALADYKYEQSLDMAAEFGKVSKQLTDTWAKADEKVSKSDISRQSSKTVIRIVISALNDAMKLGLGQAGDLTNADQQGRISQLAQRFDAETAAEKISDCFGSIGWTEASVNEKLVFEQLLLNLADSGTMKV